ncbi:protein yellow-like [Thrips palmi]|uniref:Protein yellow-like n=1 Tax=Thrips palmi TaxID=161013 RepID=A0A6P8ZRX7_THRPL|nr:protein yellow-like [Thrips palmi]XP_034247950.1 protein yellow-like [Thrips palmi]
MTRWAFLVLLLAPLAAADLEVMAQWGLLDFAAPFNFPGSDGASAASWVFTGFEVGWDKIYLSIPRFQPGLPATVGWIPRPAAGGLAESPKIQAFPSWDWHVAAASGNAKANNCSGLVSVFRVRADRCNRLWVLDSGVSDTLATFNVDCPPKLLVFDMATDRLLRVVVFPQAVLRLNSLLTNFVIDDLHQGAPSSPGSCDNAFVYLSDTTAPGLVVYDVQRDSAWRISHPSMFPSPDHGTYRVAGESFTLMDGLIGLALSPVLNAAGMAKVLYFQPFASDRISAVATAALQTQPKDDGDLPVALVGTKSSQAAPLAVDPRDGALIFSPVSETAVAAWEPLSNQHRVLAYNPALLQFVLDLRVADRDAGNLWLISTRFQKFFRRTVNPREVNLRVMRITASQADILNNSVIYK